MPERHVNADGAACLYLPEDLLVRGGGQRMGIHEFLDGPVRNYFLRQAGVELSIPFPLGEWSHGEGGFWEMMSELFRKADPGTSGLLNADPLAPSARSLCYRLRPAIISLAHALQALPAAFPSLMPSPAPSPSGRWAELLRS